MQIIVLTTLLCFFTQADLVMAYPGYQENIPNGNIVPNPCDPTLLWHGVGHEDYRGGGSRNSFGRDFLAEGYEWTRNLCQKDSDGDGKTNGEELGDPDCVWKKGTSPTITDQSRISHPGICQPIDSPSCATNNDFLYSSHCEALGVTTPTFDEWCPSIKDSDVKTVVIRFENTSLTDEETQYMCQEFRLPNSEDYEIIAWEPIIDNRAILHHTIMFACDFEGQDDMELNMDEPVLCGMTPACFSMVIVWGYGMGGQCYPDSVGAPFGNSSYSRVILQHHYNNEAEQHGYIDSSGLKIYYTLKKRPIDKGLFVFGDAYLTIPPKTSYFEAGGLLPGTCTPRLLFPPQNYSITTLLFHIHKQGSYGLVEIIKQSGEKVVLLDESVIYDIPKTIQWNPPNQIVIEPGDAINIRCGYSTMNKDDWSFFGPQTTDEMCYAFMDIFPRPWGVNFMMTQTFGDGLNQCNAGPVTKGCDWAVFFNKMQLDHSVPVESSEPTMAMLDSCVCNGPENYPAKACSWKCYQFLMKYKLFGNPCILDDPVFQTGMRSFFEDSGILHRAQSQMAFCETLMKPPRNDQTCEAN